MVVKPGFDIENNSKLFQEHDANISRKHIAFGLIFVEDIGTVCFGQWYPHPYVLNGDKFVRSIKAFAVTHEALPSYVCDYSLLSGFESPVIFLGNSALKRSNIAVYSPYNGA